MKNDKKIVILMLIVLLLILVGDSMYAYINNSTPIIHLKDTSKNIDEGIFFNVYHCGNKENKIVGKLSKYECSVDDKDNKEKTTTTTTKINERKKTFSEEILNEYIEYGNVDKDNLKSFDITKILSYGYYASKPDEIYYQVEFKYECKDRTDKCVNLRIDWDGDYDVLYHDDGIQIIWIIAKNDKVIKFMNGVTVNINSNFIFTDEKI